MLQYVTSGYLAEYALLMVVTLIKLTLINYMVFDTGFFSIFISLHEPVSHSDRIIR